MNPVPLRTMSKGIALLNLIEGHTAVTAPPALLSIIYIMALFANNVILYGYAVGCYICVPSHGLICCALPKVNISPQELLTIMWSAALCVRVLFIQVKAYTYVA